MLKKLYYAIAGDPNEKVLKRFRPIVDEINALEKEYEAKSADELRSISATFRGQIAEATAELHTELDEATQAYMEVLGTEDQKYARVEMERVKKELLAAEAEVLDEILPHAFAAVREAGKRSINKRHYDVQLIGGMVLHNGMIAEMKTGEGKTLVATLPMYLNALAGRGVHLVTPNDYLSKVGLQLMGPVYHALGMSAAVIQNSAGNPDAGSFLYDPEYPAADDRFLSLRPITRQEAYAADILYGTNNEFGFDYLRDNMAQDLNRCVQRPLHFAIVDEVDNILIDEARTPLIISGEARESSNYYSLFAQQVRSLEPERDYVVNEKDRIVTLTEDGIASIERRMNLQNLYAPENFEMIPYLDNALRANVLYKRDKDYIVRNGSEVVIVDEFTGRLMEGRRYSEGLHQAIEAKEGVKVQKESMTLATVTFQNFFRMYNKLAGMTGTAKTEEEEFQRIYNLDVIMVPTYRPVIRDDEADLVYRSEPAKFKAVLDDIQESHQREQPVLVGTVAIETSERLSDMLRRRGIQHEVLNAKNHEREALIIAQAGRPGSVTIATNMAGRGVDILLGGNAEGLAREQLRKQGVELGEIPQRAWNECLDMIQRGQDPTTVYNTPWAEALRDSFRQTDDDKKKVQGLGGLRVVGTERHEARRIDNQLRGRAGRLGDPGSSRFYVSMEDELMRRFGGDRMGSIMDRLGLEEDVPIEAGLVSKAIENAQTRVEGYNFDTRKHVLQYDEVVNEQRNRIYEQRRRILTEPSMQASIIDMIGEEVTSIVGQYTAAEYNDEWQLGDLEQALRALYPIPASFSAEQWKEKDRDEIEADAVKMAMEAYAAKEAVITPDLMRMVEKQLMLRTVDMRWVHHLTDLDHLREGIGLRAVAQADPLVAYKREAYNMYGELMGDIRGDIVKQIFAFTLTPAQTSNLAPARPAGEPAVADTENGQAAKPVSAPAKPVAIPGLDSPMAKNIRTNRDTSVSQTVKKSGPQLGRNDPCWCGSGKKYKNCHMQADAKQGTPQGAGAKR